MNFTNILWSKVDTKEYIQNSFICVTFENRQTTLFGSNIYTGTKIIKKSKGMVIIKIKTVVTSRRKESLIIRKGNIGPSEVLAVFSFLIWGWSDGYLL